MSLRRTNMRLRYRLAGSSEPVAPMLISFKGERVATSGRAVDLMHKVFHRLPMEQMWGLALSAKHDVLCAYMVSSGGRFNSVVDVPLVVTPPLILGASGFLLMHNHPSGDVTPSPEDNAVTERLHTASAYLGLRFLDHIVVSDTTYYSMLEAGVLPASAGQ